jgi:hypothetical protein
MLLLPPAVSFISFFVSATKTQTSSFIKMDEYDETEEENNTLFITIYSALLMSVYMDVSTAPVIHPFSTSDLTGPTLWTVMVHRAVSTGKFI